MKLTRKDMLKSQIQIEAYGEITEEQRKEYFHTAYSLLKHLGNTRTSARSLGDLSKLTGKEENEVARQIIALRNSGIKINYCSFGYYLDKKNSETKHHVEIR